MSLERIRNFSIIAHIDHGKSTLADRLLERTNTISQRETRDQFLDKMEIERERGITIKAATVRLLYKAKDGKSYQLNLIDTPGHVDFNYEVSRSLAACEGALLVVDASQGVEAQTLANVYLALERDLTIVPVINKIDLPSAQPDVAKDEIEDIIGIDASDALLASAKNGIGIDEILEAIVTRVPPPTGDPEAVLEALVFDSWFDAYLGALCQVRVLNGTVKKGDKIKIFSTGKEFEVTRVAAFLPEAVEVATLKAGEVGVIAAGIKDVRDTKVGDTITATLNGVDKPIPGFIEPKPMVFAGMFPVDNDQYHELREALEKLRLNDSAFTFEPETSAALGFGFRCGFLGLLHAEIVQERLEREYNLALISTAPTVVYQVTKSDHTDLRVDNPAILPDPSHIEEIREPYIRATIHVPKEFVGNVMALCENRRGMQEKLEYHVRDRVMITYLMPFNEMVFDFYDKLKSSTKGYASLDYEIVEYRAGDLVKVDILINGDKVDALSMICHRDKAHERGKMLVTKIKEHVPRQQFDVAIQAAIGGKIISRETSKALRKDVTAKCYGGDISRKRKLLEKQKEGKKRMKQLGNVELPQEAFRAILKVDV
jgi:GTP-binding protein LepA